MIVVLGRPGLGPAGVGGAQPLDGLAALVAVAAARAGARVELVGAIGDDPSGDAVAVALGRAGVGHAALARDPAGATPSRDRAPGAALPRLDAADIELALRYLAECRVIVVADPLDEAAAAAVMDAAGYHGADVVAVALPGRPIPAAWDRGATVLAAPEPDEDDAAPGGPGGVAVDEAWVGVVAGFAVALASGVPAAEALARAAAGGGWERASEDGEDDW